MSYTNGLDDPTTLFNTVLYTGNDSSQSITGVGFQPDWIWLKSRAGTYGAYNPQAYDSVRGFNTGGDLTPANSNVEGVDSGAHGYISAVGADGFTLGAGSTNSHQNNGASTTYVSWNWKAGGSASSNSNGSITSSVSANTTAGFSIVSYTGTGANATVGHGLGAAPAMIIQKNRIDGQPWWVYHSSIGAGGQLRLSGTDAAGSDGGVLWNSTAPTSTVFSLGDNGGSNGSSDACIAYCFAEKQGYSKFGKYVGSGSASSGTFIYTGFKPTWVMNKATSISGENWQINDIKRKTFNVNSTSLFANSHIAESSDGMYIDILSNGFKARETGNGTNGSGVSYIYAAFAESPFVTSTGVPTTAR